jgi:hypothetical protein
MAIVLTQIVERPGAGLFHELQAAMRSGRLKTLFVGRLARKYARMIVPNVLQFLASEPPGKAGATPQRHVKSCHRTQRWSQSRRGSVRIERRRS